MQHALPLDKLLALALWPRLTWKKRLQFGLEKPLSELWALLNESPQQLGLKPLTSKALADIEQAQRWHNASPNHHIITPDSPYYPALLNNIDDAPLVLFAKGNLHALSLPAVAIVGARECSDGGRKIAGWLAKELAGLKINIVSGLAAGIDAHAHDGALQANGATTAVLGSGLESIYPASNKHLANKIIENGVLLSEYLPSQPPRPYQFPKRNRIVTGIAIGLIVVEAKIKSGSLISAKLAAEQGREVMAVPGHIFNPYAKGCFELIKQGAHLISSIEDVVNIIEPQIDFMLEPNTEPQQQLCSHPFLDIVGYEGCTLDRIIQVSGLSADDVLQQIIELELEGKIVSVAGGYIRV